MEAMPKCHCNAAAGGYDTDIYTGAVKFRRHDLCDGVFDITYHCAQGCHPVSCSRPTYRRCRRCHMPTCWGCARVPAPPNPAPGFCPDCLASEYDDGIER